MHAADQRVRVIRAATHEFAAHGYAGTSTQSIAERARMSQPYLFRLFGTKRSLFLAVVHDAFLRCRTALEASAQANRAASPDTMLEALRRAYRGAAVDPDLLGLQLQACAACDDPDIRAVVREEWAALHEAVRRWSGAEDAAVHAWFAELMLFIVATTVGDPTRGSIGLCPAGPGQAADAPDRSASG
jgi:AcrR family transcriptional regulator